MLMDYFTQQMDEKKILPEHHLAHTNTIDKLLTFITGRGHPTDIQVVANSPEIHKLILVNPVVFTDIFSREHVKSIIYQACILGNLSLVKCLIETIKLNVVNETVSNPFGNFRVLKNGDYEFLDHLPVVQAAAKSNSLDLIQYLASFYDQAQLDKTGIEGHLQGALVMASANDAYDNVQYLLSCGVNANSVFKEAHTTPALHHAVLTGSMGLVELLVESGAIITELNQYVAVKNGRLDVVSYFLSKGINFKDGAGDVSLMTALESRSVEMVKYFMSTLKFNLYPAHCASVVLKLDWELEIVKKVLRSGSVDMLQYIENELHLPVSIFLNTERETIKSLHPLHGRTLLFEAVSSYSVALLKFLFETKGLIPSQKQLAQLTSYAFDSRLLDIRHQKFLTHVYLTSFLHDDQNMRKLLHDVAEIGDLQCLSIEELLMLYAEYTKNFNEIPARLEHGNKFCDNAIYLANEISSRGLSADDLLDVAQQNNFKLLPAVRFYLTVTAPGYSSKLLRDVMHRSTMPAVIGPAVNMPCSGANEALTDSVNQVVATRRAPLRFFESNGLSHLNASTEIRLNKISGPLVDSREDQACLQAQPGT